MDRRGSAWLKRALVLAGASALALAALASPPQVAARASCSLLVSFASGSDDAGVREALASQGLTVEERLAPLPVYRVGALSAGDCAREAQRVQASTGAVSAEVEGEQRAAEVPNDDLYARYQWNLRQVGLEQAWDLRPSAPDIVVAVLDTGVDISHPDLQSNLLLSNAYNALDGSTNVQDDDGHGTAVAGVIGAVGNNGVGVAGTAWRVKILPIKTLGAGGLGPDSAMVKGLTYAADQGAQIINVSSTGASDSPALEQAVAYAEGKGALIVAAAGNSDTQGGVTFPASYPGVLAVGASDQQNNLAAFSQPASYVGLLAPGVDVTSTNWAGAGYGAYSAQSGTSMAAPEVSGTAALLWELRPDLLASDVASALTNTATPAGGGAPGWGSGVLNAAGAIASVRLGVRPTDGSVALKPTTPSSPVPFPTPPAMQPQTWYFAEGSTKAPFSTEFDLQNPNPTAAMAHFTFIGADGSQTGQDVPVAANSRVSYQASGAVSGKDFSAVVQSNTSLVVERAESFGHSGHSSVGARAPARTWYMPEGSSTGGFDTWIVLLNPGTSPAQAKLSFYQEDGTVRTDQETVAPMGRLSVHANSFVASSGFATEVDADQPIVAERTTYFDQGQAGSSSVGLTQTTRTWWLANGVSRPGFDTWLLVENPTSTPANTRVTLMSDAGTVVTQPLLVPAHGRASLYTNQVLPNSTFGMRVDSDQPVAAERSIYTNGGSTGASAPAVVAPSSEWFLPGGSTMGSFEEQLTVLNPQAQPAHVEVDFTRQDGRTAASQTLLVGPTTAQTFDLNQYAPDAQVALHVLADQPIAVERMSYFIQNGGQGMTSSSGATRNPGG